MPGIGDLVAKMKVDNQPWKKGLSGARSSLSSFVGGAAKLLGPLAAGIGAVWGGSKAVSAYKTQLQAQQKLQAVLKATGGAAELSAQEIADFASQRQGITNFSDEATIAASGVLATFKEIKGDIFKDALVAGQDMAAVLGTDMQGSMIQLGKALNDPMRGITALSRAGVSFTEQQKEQIRTMQEAGDIAGAQRIILAELQGEFGGAAEAMADPWTQMQNALGDVGEMFGSLLLPGINVVSSAITTGVGYLTQYTDTFKSMGITAAAWLTQIGKAWLTYITKVGTLVSAGVSFIWDAFTDLFNFVAGDGGMSFVDLGVEAVVTMSHITDIIKLAAVDWTLSLVKFGNDAAFWFTDKLPAYVTWFADNWKDILFTAGDYALTVFINLGENIRSLWDATLDFIAGRGFDFDWTPLTEGAASAIKEMPDIPERAATAFENALQADVDSMGMALTQSMDAQRKTVRDSLKSDREAIASSFDTAFTPPESANGEGGQGTAGAAGGSSETKFASVATKGSSEALKTIMFSRDNIEAKARKKAEQQRQAQLAALQTIAKNSEPQFAPEFG